RLVSDWSSDVCSSDLYFLQRESILHGVGKWVRECGIDHGREPDTGGEAGDPTDGGRRDAGRQDGEPDVRGCAGRSEAAHGLHIADVLDELGQADSRARVRSAVSDRKSVV